jgi:hypothetical protein
MLPFLRFSVLLGFTLGAVGQTGGTAGISKARLLWIDEHGTILSERETIGVAHGLSSAQRESLIRFFISEIRPEMSLLGIGSESELRQAASEQVVRLIDLNRDGVPEVVSRANGEWSGCSPSGNCSFSVLERTAKGYKTILDGVARFFSVEKTETNGFQDIVLGMHGSATETELKVYQYRDGKYRKTACYDADWSILVNDQVVDLQKPRITSVVC